MKLPRRNFLHLAAGAAALPVVSRIAWAQTYPTRPVRLIVGFTPGGPTDIAARLIGQWLSERFGQPFVIENRPGAGSNIATETVVNSQPDGHTLLMVSTSAAVSATFYRNLNFNLIRDIAPVAGIVRVPLVMVVNPSVPTQTVPEFIAYAKANPGKIIMASVGNGTTPHMAGELFKMMAGVDMLHVPYRGAAPALTDLLSGRAQVMFEGMLSLTEHIRTGRLRPLAVCRPWANFSQDTRQAFGSASVRPRPRPPRSWTSSTKRSMQASPIPSLRRGLASWAAQRLRFLRPSLEGSSPKTRISGAR